MSVLVADRQHAERARLAATIGGASADSDIVVDLADSGPDLFCRLREKIYDLVFIDMSLPDIDVAKLKQVFDRIRVNRMSKLVLTAVRLPGDWIEIARCLHAYDVLIKPVRDEVVVGILRSCIRQRTIKKALVVDGGEISRSLVSRVLEGSHFGMKAVAVENGAMALRAARLEHYDLVLIDFAPCGNGPADIPPLELACRLLAQSQDKTKVVMMDRRMERAHKTLDLFGISGVVIKPFGSVALDRCLHASFGLWRPYLVDAELALRDDLVFSAEAGCAAA